VGVTIVDSSKIGSQSKKDARSSVNNRERIIRTVQGKPVDRTPFFLYMGLWQETLDRWVEEGLSFEDRWDEAFGFDAGMRSITECWSEGHVNLGFCPWFEEEILERRVNSQVVRDRFGIVKEVRIEGESLPRYLEHPVKDREDWERLKRERLDPDDPARFPEGWVEAGFSLRAAGCFLQAGDYPFGLFGACRDLMGVENLLVACCTEPDLVQDMMGYLTEFWLALFKRIVGRVPIDGVHMWEDMSGRNGSLLSPDMVRRFMLPNYRKIARFCRDRGIPVFSVDTDGDVRDLAPLFVEAGVNLLWPFEVAAGCDVNEYLAKYPALAAMGGIDKRALARGRHAIDEELARVAPALRTGRYIPSPDHAVPPDVSYEDFRYFVERLREAVSADRTESTFQERQEP
jgi:uroporphyrinogen-III decarboxylase